MILENGVVDRETPKHVILLPAPTSAGTHQYTNSSTSPQMLDHRDYVHIEFVTVQIIRNIEEKRSLMEIDRWNEYKPGKRMVVSEKSSSAHVIV